MNNICSVNYVTWLNFLPENSDNYFYERARQTHQDQLGRHLHSETFLLHSFLSVQAFMQKHLFTFPLTVVYAS